MNTLKILMVFIALLFAVNTVYGDTPSYAAVDGYYVWKHDTTIVDSALSAAGWDTIAASDSSGYLFQNFEPKHGWQYFLFHDSISGSGADSVAMELKVYSMDEDNEILYWTRVDSFTSASGESALIPFGNIIGSSFCAKLFSYTGHGGQAILHNLSMYRRKVMNLIKRD